MPVQTVKTPTRLLRLPSDQDPHHLSPYQHYSEANLIKIQDKTTSIIKRICVSLDSSQMSFRHLQCKRSRPLDKVATLPHTDMQPYEQLKFLSRPTCLVVCVSPAPTNLGLRKPLKPHNASAQTETNHS